MKKLNVKHVIKYINYKVVITCLKHYIKYNAFLEVIKGGIIMDKTCDNCAYFEDCVYSWEMLKPERQNDICESWCKKEY
jgi:hypothetical protein